MITSGNNISVLFIDDDRLHLDLIKNYLETNYSIYVDTEVSPSEGLKKIRNSDYDVVISDFRMPGTNGIEFLKMVRSSGSNIPFIIFTGNGDEETAIKALNSGADYYVRKGRELEIQAGELYHYIILASGRRERDRLILQHEQRISDIINFLPDATFAINTEGRVIAWNRAMEEITAVPAADIIDKGDYEYSLPFYGRKHSMLVDLILHEDLKTEALYQKMFNDKENRLSAEIYLPDFCGGSGSYFWATASPLYDSDGEIAGAIESIRDITEYKISEGLYETIFQNTHIAMIILEEDLNISRVNERMTWLLGYSRDEITDHFFSQFIAEDDQERLLEYLSPGFSDCNTAPKEYECRLTCKNGEIKIASTVVSPIPGTKKSILSFIDITEKKEIEKRLRFTQFSIDSAPVGIIWIDAEGRFISANHNTADLFGYPLEELTGMSIADITHDFEYDIFMKRRDLAKEQGSFTFEDSFVRKDGSITVFEITTGFFNFEGAEYECSFVKDVSKRKKAEKALIESETKFREIFQAASDMIFLAERIPEGPPGKFVEMNDATCNILGYSREELLKMSIMEIEAPPTREKYYGLIDEFEKTGRAKFETMAFRKDGSLVYLENNASHLKMNDQVYHLNVGRDITERKKMEKTLRIMNKKLNLLSSITRHDLNNWIHVLIMNEDRLKNEIEDKKALKHLDFIIRATELIKNHLEFTRDYEELGVKDPAWQALEPIVHSAGLSLNCDDMILDIKTVLPEIYADPMLDKVIYNIFDNSIRHGEHVTEMTISFDENENSGVLVIEDNGAGVPDNMKDEIFSRGVGSNTGLGLFLARDILDITGICISETGTEGRGARFEIVIRKDDYRFAENT